MRFFANAKYDFISKRKFAYVAAAVSMAVFLTAALVGQFARGSWLNYGVDFTGGTLIQVVFTQPTSVSDLRSSVQPAFPGAEITRFGGDNEYLVRAPQFSEDGVNVADRVTQTLRGQYGDAFEVVRTEAVGPKIGGELQSKALLAILFSFAATLIYLAIRFEWRFGVAAVIATAHDILVTLGLIALFRIEVSLPIVAAVLTIVGYSLNDTIIVFDRVRENNKNLGRRLEHIDLINRSINETLPRTVLTSGTTLGTLLALFIFGGGAIMNFAMILIVGVIIGTYSSIFVASPALLEIEKRWPRKETAARPGNRAARAARVTA